ncbi:MAG: hypothetical protein K2P77_10630, partial [Burkholderiaceae bacterium]|nr:hypothetical protein [Burkholderiaceae bacterium]
MAQLTTDSTPFPVKTVGQRTKQLIFNKYFFLLSDADGKINRPKQPVYPLIFPRHAVKQYRGGTNRHLARPYRKSM